MAYNNEEALRVVVDIETAPLDEAGEFLEPAEAPANYKDTAKIAEYVTAKNAENLSRAALDVDLCRVVAVGFIREDWNEPQIYTMDQPVSEASWLAAFWRHLGQRTTIGYNTLGFDLPVLLRRSLYLGVPTPSVSLDRYRTNHIDLQQKLSFNGLLKFRGLSFYCKRFGIPCEDETPGSQIGELVKAGEWDRVVAHCRSDVLKTKALAERMGLLERQLEPSEAF